ncbi:hypothetical protein [Lacrimispora xylanisolvens]|uniref:hypothetical protein n=1 Tax=Lacrimispora xylanisolvens TaxID=384636 RepID=UPI003D9CA993
MNTINDVIEKMMEYYKGDPKRIQHFIKVYQFGKLIGEEEGLDAKMQRILETACVVHDIGIKASEEISQQRRQLPGAGGTAHCKRSSCVS